MSVKSSEFNTIETLGKLKAIHEITNSISDFPKEIKKELMNLRKITHKIMITVWDYTDKYIIENDT